MSLKLLLHLNAKALAMRVSIAPLCRRTRRQCHDLTVGALSQLLRAERLLPRQDELRAHDRPGLPVISEQYHP